MAIHYLKTTQPYFNDVEIGVKTFEFRKNDRDFEVGDGVYLQEYDQNKNVITGKVIFVSITYILKDFVGIKPGYCVLSIVKV